MRRPSLSQNPPRLGRVWSSVPGGQQGTQPQNLIWGVWFQQLRQQLSGGKPEAGSMTGARSRSGWKEGARSARQGRGASYHTLLSLLPAHPSRPYWVPLCLASGPALGFADGRPRLSGWRTKGRAASGFLFPPSRAPPPLSRK